MTSYRNSIHPDLRVARPDLTYLSPAHDRWAASYWVNGAGAYEWHRYAVIDPQSNTAESDDRGLLHCADANVYRDATSRCGSAQSTLTYSTRTADDAVCDVCGTLDPAADVPAVDPVTAADRASVAVSFYDVSSFPIGTDADADANRGAQAVAAYRNYPGHTVWHTVTLADVVAYWQVRHAAYWADMGYVGRTIRAMARSRSWEYHYDRHMCEAIEAADMPAVIRPTVDRPTEIEGGGNRAVDIDRARGYLPVAAPTSVTDIAYSATMADVLASVAALEVSSAAALDAIADVLLSAADANDWCGEYEQSIDKLHNGLSSYAMQTGEVFHPRDRDAEYIVRGTVDITITVPWSTVVTAACEDDADRMVDSDYVDVTDYLYGQRVQDLDYTVDWNSMSTDDVERNY